MKLPDHDATPRIEKFMTMEGEAHESLSWGNTSQSPASKWAATAPNKLEFGTLTKRLKEVLELPGEARDYHFAIQNCISELWKLRRSDPATHAAIEHLSWLNIRLIEALPQTVQDEYSKESKYYKVLAFDQLMRLYEREGFIREALEVAEIAKRFGQGEEAFDRLSDALSTLEAEDAG